jgi:hypothetical protein
MVFADALRVFTSGCLGICLLAGCEDRAPAAPGPVASDLDQSNMPAWQGAWSIIGRGVTIPRFAQTITPSKSRLTAIEIDIQTGNLGKGGDDVTVKIVAGGQVLGTMSRSVPEGHDGILRFDFADPGIAVTPGVAFQLQVEDTNKDVFGWRYGLNTYAAGTAFFEGAPWNNGAFDIRFRTYGY